MNSGEPSVFRCNWRSFQAKIASHSSSRWMEAPVTSTYISSWSLATTFFKSVSKQILAAWRSLYLSPQEYFSSTPTAFGKDSGQVSISINTSTALWQQAYPYPEVSLSFHQLVNHKNISKLTSLRRINRWSQHSQHRQPLNQRVNHPHFGLVPVHFPGGSDDTQLWRGRWEDQSALCPLRLGLSIVQWNLRGEYRLS